MNHFQKYYKATGRPHIIGKGVEKNCGGLSRRGVGIGLGVGGGSGRIPGQVCHPVVGTGIRGEHYK